MAQEIGILSGTRDDLGGVEVAIANVYERPERPGAPSGLLILAGESRIIAVGDELQLGGRRFRLDAIRPHRTGAFTFVFTEVVAAPPAGGSRRPYADHRVPAVGAERLARILRDLTPAFLAALDPARPCPALTGWHLDSRESWTEEWNREQLGPSKHHDHQARFADGEGSRIEARIRHDVIRWNPQEVHRVELSGSWLRGAAALSLFARAEGMTRFGALSTSGFTEAMLAELRAALAA